MTKKEIIKAVSEMLNNPEEIMTVSMVTIRKKAAGNLVVRSTNKVELRTPEDGEKCMELCEMLHRTAQEWRDGLNKKES